VLSQPIGHSGLELHCAHLLMKDKMFKEVWIEAHEVREVQAARARMKKFELLNHTQRAFLVLSGDSAAAQYKKDCELVSAYQIKFWNDKNTPH